MNTTTKLFLSTILGLFILNTSISAQENTVLEGIESEIREEQKYIDAEQEDLDKKKANAYGLEKADKRAKKNAKKLEKAEINLKKREDAVEKAEKNIIKREERKEKADKKVLKKERAIRKAKMKEQAKNADDYNKY